MSEYVASPAEKLISGSPGHVTLEDVKRAVEKLKAAGEKVSTGTVHAELGRGSKTTICKHYAALKVSIEASTPLVPAPLSPALLTDIGNEINKLVKVRTSQLSDELEDVQKSLLAVVAESESYRAAAIEANSRTAALQLSFAEQTGSLETLRGRLELLSNELAQLGCEAESARQSLAIAKERLRASEERVERLESERERNRSELLEVRAETTTLRAQLEKSLRECVSLQVTAESNRQAAERLEGALGEQDLLQSQLVEVRNRLASSEAQQLGLAERLKDSQAAQSRAEGTCELLLQKVLRNRAFQTEPDNPAIPLNEGGQKGPSQ